MSAFNILNVSVRCAQCEEPHEIRIQFKFGETWQHEFEIGDSIKWGGNEVGSPNFSTVKVYGIVEYGKCSYCGFNNADEYDILIKDNKITGIKVLENIDIYNNESEGNFVITS